VVAGLRLVVSAFEQVLGKLADAQGGRTDEQVAGDLAEGAVSARRRLPIPVGGAGFADLGGGCR
jgi:hypothetical protein